MTILVDSFDKFVMTKKLESLNTKHRRSASMKRKHKKLERNSNLMVHYQAYKYTLAGRLNTDGEREIERKKRDRI